MNTTTVQLASLASRARPAAVSRSLDGVTGEAAATGGAGAVACGGTSGIGRSATAGAGVARGAEGDDAHADPARARARAQGRTPGAVRKGDGMTAPILGWWVGNGNASSGRSGPEPVVTSVRPRPENLRRAADGLPRAANGLPRVTEGLTRICEGLQRTTEGLRRSLAEGPWEWSKSVPVLVP